MSWFSDVWGSVVRFFSGPPTPAAPPAPLPVAPSAPAGPSGGSVAQAGGVSAMGDQAFFDQAGAPGKNDFAQIKAWPGVFSAQVLNYGWDQLNPASGSCDFSAIDADLATAAALDVPVELRIVCGVHVPAWVMALAGSVTVPDKKNGQTIAGASVVFAQYWSTAYQAALRAFQAALAARYDGNPAVRTVWCMTCTSWTCETGNIGGDPDVRRALYAGGATDALIQGCIGGVFVDMAAWRYTPIGLTICPLVSVEMPSAPGTTAFPMALAQQAVRAWGARCVLANMGADSTKTGLNAEIVKSLPGFGAYTAFQTDGPTIDQSTNALWAAGLGYDEWQAWPAKAAGGVADYSEFTVGAVNAALAKFQGA